MADIKFTDLPPAGPLDGTEILAGVQGSDSVQLTTLAVANLATAADISTDQRVLGLSSGAPAPAAELTASAVLDWLGSTGGMILFRGSGGWEALSIGSSGQIPTVNDSAEPEWDDVVDILATAGVKYTTPLFDHYVNSGNGTTVETDLYSDTLAAGQLAADGDKVSAQYGGVFVSSATATRQVRIYFGGTLVFDTGTLTLSLSAAWDVYVDLIRVSASVVRACVSFTTEGAALAAYTAYTEVTGLTLSATNVLKITGQAAGVGAASNDIVAKMGSVTYTPAA